MELVSKVNILNKVLRLPTLLGVFAFYCMLAMYVTAILIFLDVIFCKALLEFFYSFILFL